jgi:hypothetical protein
LVSEITSPAFGQGFKLHCTPQRFQIILLKRVQANDVVNTDAIAIAPEPLYCVSGLNLAFS